MEPKMILHFEIYTSNLNDITYRKNNNRGQRPANNGYSAPSSQSYGAPSSGYAAPTAQTASAGLFSIGISGYSLNQRHLY